MEILQNFGIQPILLLAQIVNFVIILAILKRFFYKPIAKVLDDRKKRIEESLNNAQSIEERLQKTQEKSAQILEEAQNNAQALIADAKKETERIFLAASQEAKLQVEETLKATQLQIEAQRQQMQKELSAQTLTLVIEVVRRVLGRTLKSKEKRELTESAVTEIGKQIQ